MRLNVDAVWGTAGIYDGAFTGSDLYFGRGSDYAAGIRNVQVYDAADEAKIDQLMAAVTAGGWPVTFNGEQVYA